MSDQAKAEVATPSYPLDRRTAVLLGQYIGKARAENSPPVSAGGVATGIRTEDWVISFERGELDVTERMLKAMGAMLGRQGIVLDLASKAADLQQFAQGLEARRLSRSLPRGDLQRFSPASMDSSSRPASLLESVSHDDRFLVVTPLVLGASLLMLSIRVLDWSLAPDGADRSSLSSIIRLVDKVLVPALLLGVAVAALALSAIDRGFVRATRTLRSVARQSEMNDCDRQVRRQGVQGWADAQDWRVSGIVGQMIPRWRAHALEASMRVGFLERIEPMVMVGVLASLLGSASAGVVDSFGPSAVPSAILCVSLLILRRQVRAAADRSATQLHTKLARALGLYDQNVPALWAIPSP